MKVLVVDDHQELLDVVGVTLAADGHRVDTVRTAREAELRLLNHTYDVVVLDLGLPDGSGRDVCRRARDSGLMTPILVLTAQNSVDSRVSCLDTGADDFLGKPFAIAELKARIRALGRRVGAHASLRYVRGDICLDFAKRVASVAGNEVPVTTREWGILELLALANGRLVPRSQILDEVWGESQSAASLEVLINRIRKKLGTDFVVTVRGEGYRLG